MAFTATYKLKTSSSATISIAGAYFRIDGTSITGGKDSGYSAIARAYINAATREADRGDFIPDSSFSVETPYVENQDPYPALYAVAKTNYSDAVDA